MPKKRSKGAPAGNKQCGTFATSDSINNFVNPGISIDPIGLIRLPLSAEDTKAIAHASHKAPFGKDQRTLVEESVRKTWEIQASEVRILNPEWRSCVDRIAARVADELGVGRKGVHAELHKMLLYEKGGMFKRHQDTEKVAGMFGTLVICLPSQHTGGAVRLQLGNDSIHMQTEKNSAFNATFLAWYADVQHEIEQVFRNSVVAIVHRDAIHILFLPGQLRLSHLQSWVAKLDREMTEELFDMQAHEILLQTCRNTISSQYNSDSERTECLALIAEAAILLQDLALFKDAVQAPRMYFKRSFYQMLGRSIYLRDPWVDENELCTDMAVLKRQFRNDATKKEYTIDWVGRQFLELLASAPDVKECAIASLIQFLKGWGIEVPRNHNETVRKALRSLVHDATQQGNFAMTLALHLSYELQHFEESDDFLGDIFRHLLEVVAEPAASAFNLKWYASDVFGYRKRSQRNGPSSAVGSLGHFYQHLSTFNERACATLAERIQTQARSLDNQQLQSILYPLLREMLEHLDEASAEASRLIQWLTERYVTQTVGLEPDRNVSHGAAPSDWACPQEALTGCRVGGCRACAKLHAFLRDPHERTLSCDANNNYEIFKSPNHIGYRFRRDDSQTKYFDIEWGEVEITFTKVDELLDSEHQTWEKRCNNMTSTLKELPEKKWRAFLAHRYDELINVEIVKTGFVATKPAAPVELPGASESSATNAIRSKLPRRTKGAQG
ncbi:hypothetical protein SLS60_009161 [Paraconiothyrium brasiliense]|uniref:Prolyl 4-hydroxylase alpha subunit Fe(2+) 2OG dioxygenase domain-containing protein n=1 Tax=Paraconiothyrium brasiliense TaxID=300254 RepID=A0ABR3QWH6_9PLEO